MRCDQADLVPANKLHDDLQLKKITFRDQLMQPLAAEAVVEAEPLHKRVGVGCEGGKVGRVSDGRHGRRCAR